MRPCVRASPGIIWQCLTEPLTEKQERGRDPITLLQVPATPLWRRKGAMTQVTDSKRPVYAPMARGEHDRGAARGKPNKPPPEGLPVRSDRQPPHWLSYAPVPQNDSPYGMWGLRQGGA